MSADDALAGCEGRITVATRGAGGPGEVLIRTRGGTEAYLAWSEQPLARGTTVLVLSGRGVRAVDVVQWPPA